MEHMCLKCGGLVGEPGKAYGYAGKWCHCGGGTGWFRQQEAVEISVREKVLAQQALQLAPNEVSAKDFVWWLRGFLTAAAGEFITAAGKQRILDELKRVR